MGELIARGPAVGRQLKRGLRRARGQKGERWMTTQENGPARHVEPPTGRRLDKRPWPLNLQVRRDGPPADERASVIAGDWYE